MRFLLLAIALLSFCTVRAQSYIPIDTADLLLREASIEKYKKVDELYIAGIKEQYKGKEGKSLVLELQDYSDKFIEKIREGEFCYDERFIGKTEKILSELRATNEMTFNDINILISKDPSLNAYCLPNGTFVVNMGVFYWLENSDQIAALIAHEMAHEVLNHPLRNILNVINDDLSKESHETLKSVRSLRYNKQEKALELFKRKLYATGDARRKEEFEADSAGYLLLRNTDFNCLDFIEALKLSEVYDSLTPEPVPIQIYSEVFDLPNQKFREEWLKMEDFSGYDYSKFKERFDSDSLASHPETELRIKKLEELYPELRASRTNLPDSTFKVLAIVAEFEQVPNFYYAEEYGLGIYLCLGRIWRGENVTYYKQWLGKCFAKVYEARKNYCLNRYLDAINPKVQPFEYQQYLSFMWNLSLEEIGNIRDFYLPK
jgi:hypothetical protein